MPPPWKKSIWQHKPLHSPGVFRSLGFDLEHRGTLRLRGIDAPEMTSKAGEAARAFVLSHLREADTIIIYTSRSDKYDRYLADVFTTGEGGGMFLNNLLLEHGHARQMKE